MDVKRALRAMLIAWPALDAGWCASQSDVFSGRVTFGDTPLCALVLVDARHQFTSAVAGRFAIPLDADTAMPVVQVFADGFEPHWSVAPPGFGAGRVVSMHRSPSHGPSLILDADVHRQADGSWHIDGRALGAGGDTRVTAVAGGRFAFSAYGGGGIELSAVPKAEYETLDLMLFAAGFRPYRTSVAGLRTEARAYLVAAGRARVEGVITALKPLGICIDHSCIVVPQPAPVAGVVEMNGVQVPTGADGRFGFQAPIEDPAAAIAIAASTDGRIRFWSRIPPPEPAAPPLAADPQAIEITVGAGEIVRLSGGFPPYTVSLDPLGVASASIHGGLLTVVGVSTGTAEAILGDAAGNQATLDVTVNADAPGSPVWVPVRERRDQDGDRADEQVTYYSYAEHGLWREAIDYADDGWIDWAGTYACADAENLCDFRYDAVGDGVDDGAQHLVFDARGRLIEAENTAEQGETRYWHYDEAGRETGFELDLYSDGSIDYATRTDYDAFGQRIREEVDEGADGLIDAVHTWHFRYAQGKPLECDSDRGDDGIVDQTGYFLYRSDGALSRFDLDIGSDGSIDRSVWFGPGQRVETIRQGAEQTGVEWEVRYLRRELNVPDLLKRWVWDSL